MLQEPIVIGGVGGSGTRVVADILKVFNIYIGDDLNRSLDNLTHTLLFKRPKWYYRNRLNNNKIELGIGILEKSMTNKESYSLIEFAYLISATISMTKYGHNIQKDGSGIWAFQRLRHILFSRNDIVSYTGWGWKEPNSHLILKNLNDKFPNLKYIHTIRHGLDMAYSPNQQQLFNWGKLFGVEIPKNEKDIPAASFRYWVEVNRKVIAQREKLGENKILLLNFDNLCVNPKTEIQKLIDFLGIKVSDTQLQKAVEILIIPESKGRFKKHDIAKFEKKELDFLYSMGY